MDASVSITLSYGNCSGMACAVTGSSCFSSVKLTPSTTSELSATSCPKTSGTTTLSLGFSGTTYSVSVSAGTVAVTVTL